MICELTELDDDEYIDETEELTGSDEAVDADEKADELAGYDELAVFSLVLSTVLSADEAGYELETGSLFEGEYVS